jgi:uncharacterized protein YecT (DUF1311 family)
VPTSRPRYIFTDTGRVEALLDAAQQRWPDVKDRKALLLRLAEEGSSALDLEDAQVEAAARRKRIDAALERIPRLVDAELLLSDPAWS